MVGVATGFCVTPINTIVDKSIIENANGKTNLWTGVIKGFKKLFLQPGKFFSAYEFRWIFLVYGSTYVTSNLSDHLRLSWVDPAISKLFLTFTVNTTLSLFKDKALAQKLGHGEARKFPISALNLFFMRDLVAIASAFTLPPIMGKMIEDKFGFS